MYKSSLQMFCQKKQWDLPHYETSKQGLDHLPKFTATVKVNGLTFQTSKPCGSAKEAQNEAALIAFHHFSNTAQSSLSSPSPGSEIPSSVSVDSSASTGSLHSDRPVVFHNSQAARTALSSDHSPNRNQNVYKNQLQTFAQKRSLVLPVYSSQVEGPPHARLFKANVTINGRSYGSAELHSTLKDAEQDAARVALMSLAPSQQDEAGLFKNLLQDFAQRNGLQVPTYETNMSATCHRPTFVSTVEIGGRAFTGLEAESKKQAEINAARVAYNTVKERSVTSSTVSADRSASVRSLHSDLPAANQYSQAAGSSMMSDHVPKSFQNIYKNQLQNYAQKRSWALPVYSSIVEGPPHARRFKANVTIDGQIYESAEFRSTRKDAEQDAARVALRSLVPLIPSEEDEADSFKNLSQVFGQRIGHEEPAYRTNMSVGGPVPAFPLTIEIGSGALPEQEERSKKHADINAYRVACNNLKDCSVIPSTVSADSSASIIPLHSDIPVTNHNSQAARTALTSGHAPNRQSQVCSQLSDTLLIEPTSEAKSNIASSSSLHAASASPPQQSTFLPSVKDELVAPSSTQSDTEVQARIESVPKGFYNKVVVYPRSSSKKIEGGSVLPISDDQWMAVEFVP